MKIPKTVIGVDLETYYDQDYTLKKMATSAYVRDPRFKAQCVGIRTNRERKAKWYRHEDIPKALAQYDWTTSALLAHHAAFDGLILSHHYGIVPAYYLCSMSMARPIVGHEIGAGLDEVSIRFGGQGKIKDVLEQTKGIRDLPPALMTELGIYGAQDVDEMWRVYRAMMEDFPEKELHLIHLTINAFANPVLEVDFERAERELKREIEEKRKQLNRVAKIFDLTHLRGEARRTAVTKALGQNETLAEAFRVHGVEPPKKVSPTTKKPIYAFAKGDLDFQELERHPKREVRDLYEARLAAKSTIGETRAARLIEHGRPGKLPILLNYCRAHTFRWSGGDKLNPQNFVRGGELRKSIRAPKGYKLIVADSSQIEARKNAWLWDQDDLLEIFRTGGDPYCELASSIYNRLITKSDKKERFVGKVGVLGLGYGMGAEKYQYTLAAGSMGPPVNLSLEEAFKVVNVYRRKNWKIANGWKFLDRMLLSMYQGKEETYKCLRFHKDGVDMPNGLTLHYPELQAKWDPRRERFCEYSYRNGYMRSKIYGGLFDENIVQSLARIVVAEQMLEIAERYRVVMMTHDEVVYLSPAKEAEKALEFGLQCMRKPPAWCKDIPLNAEGGFDDCYSK